MASNVPATFNEAVAQFQGQLALRASEFVKVLPSHITPDKLQRTIITAVQSDPDLLRADRQSLILACMKAAQDGLLPDKREAALVIFNENRQVDGEWVNRKLVQYMPMAFGLRKKILQSGEVTDITAKVVYREEVARGAFIYEEGTEATLRHKPLLDLTEEQAQDSEIVAAYSMATYKDGTKSYEIMRRFEIDKVRECSQTGATKDKKGRPRTPKGPWVDWYPEQAKKTVMRRHSKTLPMSGDLIDVEARDDTEWASSAMDVLDRGQPDEPTVTDTRLPTRGDLQQQIDHNPETGEIESEEETARRLDAETMRQADGTGDEQQNNDQEEDDHPSGIIANETIAKIERAEVLGDVIGAEAEFNKHAEGMREGDVERVKLAIANGKNRFKPTSKSKVQQTAGGEA